MMLYFERLVSTNCILLTTSVGKDIFSTLKYMLTFRTNVSAVWIEMFVGDVVLEIGHILSSIAANQTIIQSVHLRRSPTIKTIIHVK